MAKIIREISGWSQDKSLEYLFPYSQSLKPFYLSTSEGISGSGKYISEAHRYRRLENWHLDLTGNEVCPVLKKKEKHPRKSF